MVIDARTRKGLGWVMGMVVIQLIVGCGGGRGEGVPTGSTDVEGVSSLGSSKATSTNLKPGPVPADLLPPEAPSDLWARAISATQIDLEWTDHTLNESGFEIEVRKEGELIEIVDINYADETNKSFLSLAVDTLYAFRVRAYKTIRMVNPQDPESAPYKWRKYSAYSNTAEASTFSIDGDLDHLGFNRPWGMVTTGFEGYPDGDYPDAVARAVGFQFDTEWRIVVAGSVHSDLRNNEDFAVVKYHSDYQFSGGLVEGFGSDGRVVTDFYGGNDVATVVVPPPLGIGDTVVVAGYAQIDGRYEFALVRYLANGSPDPGFGSGGKVTTPVGEPNQNAFAYAAIRQGDGKIVVVGKAVMGTNYGFAVVRYNEGGTLDETFGNGGKVVTQFGTDDTATAIAIQPDGKILVAGYATVQGTGKDFLVMRFNNDGTPDTEFGSGGVVVPLATGDDDFLTGMVLQPDGKIVVTGYDDDFCAVRLNADGSIDGAYNFQEAFHPVRPAYAFACAIQTDDKVVLAGAAWNGLDDDFALMRVTEEGEVDPRFGINGRVTTSVGNSHDVGRAMAIQPDGKIVVVGSSRDENGHERFAVVRYGY